MSDLLKVEELAEAWRVAPRTIRDYIYRRDLPVVKFGPHAQSTIRIRREDAEAWLEKQGSSE